MFGGRRVVSHAVRGKERACRRAAHALLQTCVFYMVTMAFSRVKAQYFLPHINNKQ